MEKIKFSVAMCVYGGDNAVFFDEALGSVFNQTLKSDDVVLVVDGPVPDEIEKVITEYNNKFDSLSVFRLKENKGHGEARKEAFSHCKYDYVAIADADDISRPDRFEKQMEYFEKNLNLGAVSSNCLHFKDSIDNIINEEKVPATHKEIVKKLKTGCPIVQPAVVLNKNEVMKAGGYLDWYMAEDYYLWIRMMLSGAEFANVSDNLLYMRTTDEQMSRRGGIKYFRSIKKLYRFMLKNRAIDFFTYVFNVTTRFIVQVLLPNKARAFIRKVLQ